MPNIITRLLLEHGDYDKGLQQAQKEVGKFIDKNLSLANAGKSVVAMLSKFALGAGAVTSAVEATQKIIGSTQTATDAFGEAMEMAKASVDQFFYSLAKGDFSGFIDGLKNTTKYAREAYKALDDLGTFNIFKAPEVAENMAQREQLKAEIKTGKRNTVDEAGNVTTHILTNEEIAEAKKKLEQLGKDYVKIINDTKKKEQTAYTAMSREILSGNNFEGSQAELDAAVDYYLQNYRQYDEAAKKLEKLNAEIQENTTYEKQAHVSQMGIVTYTEHAVPNAKAEELKNSMEYRNLTAIAEIGDDTLKELMQHRVNASSATAELNRVLQSDLEALNYKKPGTSGGGSSKKSEQEELRRMKLEKTEELRKEEESYRKLAAEVLKSSGSESSRKELDEAVDYYMRNQKGFGEYTEELKKMMTQSSSDTSKAEDIKNSSEYRSLKTIAEIGDETMKELVQHRQTANEVTGELSRIAQMEKSTSETVSTKKKSVVDENGELTAEAKLDFYISGDAFDIVDQAIDERGALQIPVELGPIDEEGFLGQDYADQLQDAQKAWDSYFDNIEAKGSEASEVMGHLSSGVSNLGSLIGGETGDIVNAFGTVIDSMQGMVPVIQSITAMKKVEEVTAKADAAAEAQLAAAKAGESVAGVPLAGPALAVAAITSILGMMASIKAISFAEGGVVPGSNYQDGITARISSGEMVINSHDQKQLYDAIHSGDIGGGGSSSGVLRGETIYMAINNYLKRSGKGQIQIG